MNESISGNQNIAWWIISLAISVVCCAVIFVVFASFLVDIKVKMGEMNGRYDVMEHRLTDMSMAVENLRTRNAIQQIQILPANPAIKLPSSAVTSEEKVPAIAPQKMVTPKTSGKP